MGKVPYSLFMVFRVNQLWYKRVLNKMLDRISYLASYFFIEINSIIP